MTKEKTQAKNPHLTLWNQVQETDPAMTRRVNQRGGFTAIDSYYQIRRATELFGPLGVGWGYSADFRFEHNLVFAVVSLWYEWNGARSTPFTVCASNQLITTGKAGAAPHVDEDAAKKALTDALTKGLSYLGFSSDVFMGKFDDNRYVEQVNARHRERERQEEIQDEIVEIEDEMTLVLETVEDAASYKKAREHLIPGFLRLKTIAPQLASQYEQAMLELKKKFGDSPAPEKPKSPFKGAAQRKQYADKLAHAYAAAKSVDSLNQLVAANTLTLTQMQASGDEQDAAEFARLDQEYGAACDRLEGVPATVDGYLTAGR